MAEENGQTTPATDIQQDQAVDTTPAVTATTEQTDIEKLDAKIAELEADGAEVFADAIQILKDKRDTLVTQAAAEANSIGSGVITLETSFRQKYGNDIMNAVEIVALAAIVYRLFFF